MWQSLLVKLGMFAATVIVVFWIGWTLPTSFDREHDFIAESLEGSKAEIASGSGRVTTVSPSRVSFVGGSTIDCSRSETISPRPPRFEPGDGPGF